MVRDEDGVRATGSHARHEGGVPVTLPRDGVERVLQGGSPGRLIAPRSSHAEGQAVVREPCAALLAQVRVAVALPPCAPGHVTRLSRPSHRICSERALWVSQQDTEKSNPLCLSLCLCLCLSTSLSPLNVRNSQEVQGVALPVTHKTQPQEAGKTPLTAGREDVAFGSPQQSPREARFATEGK